jgi:hypothetical protein
MPRRVSPWAAVVSAVLTRALQVVDDDGLHGMAKRSGSKVLLDGQHVSLFLRSPIYIRKLLLPVAQQCTSPRPHCYCNITNVFAQKIVVDFFQLGGGAGLILRWSGPGVPNMVPVPASAFRCNTKQTPFEYFDIESEGGSTSALTYDRAAQLCSSQGQRLCSAAELCPDGRPRAGLDKFGHTDNWIAVNNAQNEWVTFNRADNRLCKTHTQVAGSTPAWGTQANARGQGFRRAAECCF